MPQALGLEGPLQQDMEAGSEGRARGWRPMKECAETFDNAGVKIRYGDFGREVDAGHHTDPKQHVVLAMHGLMQNSSNFGPGQADLVDPLVDAGFRVIAPDLRGMGLSDKPD